MCTAKITAFCVTTAFFVNFLSVLMQVSAVAATVNGDGSEYSFLGVGYIDPDKFKPLNGAICQYVSLVFYALACCLLRTIDAPGGGGGGSGGGGGGRGGGARRRGGTNPEGGTEERRRRGGLFEEWREVGREREDPTPGLKRARPPLLQFKSSSSTKLITRWMTRF